jgi:hypothetical protein
MQHGRHRLRFDLLLLLLIPAPPQQVQVEYGALERIHEVFFHQRHQVTDLNAFERPHPAVACAPVLVVDSIPISGGDRTHGMTSFPLLCGNENCQIAGLQCPAAKCPAYVAGVLCLALIFLAVMF